MFRKLTFLLILLLAASTASAALPAGWTGLDIAEPVFDTPGTSSEAGGIWTLTASGNDIWGGNDEFHYCYTTMRGDGQLTAYVSSITGGTNGWRKAGVMVRNTLAHDSVHAQTVTRPGTAGGSFQWRPVTPGNSFSSNYGDPDTPIWIRIVREGNSFTSFTSPDGNTWTQMGTAIEIEMATNVYVGLAATSHNRNEITTMTFENVEMLNPGLNMALNPDPYDGEMASPWDDAFGVWTMLDYEPGPDAVSFTGYFSDDKSLVEARDSSVSLGAPPFPAGSPTAYFVGYDNAAIPAHARVPLVRGKTYYWAVDIDTGSGIVSGKVWSFTVKPVKAYNPSPADGATLVPADPCTPVSWELGDVDTAGNSIAYDVFFGSDAGAVAAATTPNMSIITTNTDIGPLAKEAITYWRIDTVLTKTSPPFTVTRVTGDVWGFETLPDIPITDPNLQGWWKLDLDSGTTAIDWSGHGHHGTLMGDPQWVAGYEGNALEFDGTGDYVNIDGYKGVLAAAGVQHAFSVSNWFQTTGNAEMVTWGTNSGRQRLSWRVDGGRLRTEHGSGNLRGNTYVNDGEWHHGVLVVNTGAALRVPQTLIYVDGREDTTFSGSDNTYNLVGTADVSIGRRATNNDRYFTGVIDDVRIYDKVLSTRDIRIMVGLLAAEDPDPANGATDVSKTPTLTWSPGVLAQAVNGSVLYYSEDEDAVLNRTAPSVTLSTASYALPMTLDLGASFYWAVDAVNGVDTWPGSVWSFTVTNWLSVDDMESYTPWTTPGNNIFEAWRDGEGNCTPGNGNETGSTLTENMDAAFVLGGIQSMKYEFDNDGLVYSPCTMNQQARTHLYSKIEAQTATLASGIGSDWTVEGVKALRISFMGQLGNSTTDPLWVQLQDGSKTYGTKVFYGDFEGEDLADMNDPSWHQWDIDLADFNVDLTNVVSIVIGIGNEGSAVPGGSGTIYVDDIRLYTPRCLPNRAKPAGDFDNDCEVGYTDVAAFVDSWLLQAYPEDVWTAKAPFTSVDVGDVNMPGAFTDLGGGQYTVRGGGADIWGANDAFHYAYKPLSGDGQISIRVTDVAGPSTNAWRKAGVMIRETLDPNSSHAFMCVTAGGGGGSSFQWRSILDGDNNNQDGPGGVTTPQCIRLLRSGDQFRAFRYSGGEWVQHGNPVIVPMAQDVLIGLAVTSHDYNNESTCTFDRVCSDDFVAMDLIEDDVVNFQDYADLINAWAEEVLWPE